MQIKIIRANRGHAVVISRIGRQSFRDAFANLFNSKTELQEYLERTYQPEKIERSIARENNIYFIAFVDSVPVGFAKLKKSSLEPQIESIAQMELQKIYVLSYYHGSGAGAALMDAVIDCAVGSQPDYLWLHVHVSNKKAIRFYEKRGFQFTGSHSFIIGTQQFEFHMMSLPVSVMEPNCA
jgi:ribosomal protein S18 acetylase RimI-like enzyme